MSAQLKHRLASLKTRTSAMLQTYYDHGSIPFDEEAKNIFERYNKLREELITVNSNIFGDLIARKPCLNKDGDRFDSVGFSNVLIDISEIEKGLELLETEVPEGIKESEKLFWSRRTNPTASKNWFQDLGPAFFALVSRLGRECCFAKDFPASECSWCSGAYGISEQSVTLRLKEHLPKLSYPMQSLDRDQLFDFIEFFYQHVSKPTRWDDCDNDKCPKEFSKSAGQQYYSLEVNKLFVRFGAPFRLIQGEVTRTNSKLIEELLEEPLITDDVELNTLLTRAVRALRDKSDKRIEAAEICCKAFEHFKHRFGNNAKSSTSIMIKKLVDSDEQVQKLNEYWHALTNLGHGSIRHSKPDAPSTNDPHFAEYLFIQYYSAIQFGCKKLGLSNEKPEEFFGLNIDDDHSINIVYDLKSVKQVGG